ncbi:MAG: FISUMP domain-containing protein [Candidatus Neomarinimicrobiota bacterium]
MKLLNVSLLALIITVGCENAAGSKLEELVLEFEVTNETTVNGSNGAIDLTVTGGKLLYQFNWSNGAVTEDINNLVAGTYAVTVQSEDGQSLTDSAEVTGIVDSDTVVTGVPDSNTVVDYDGNIYPIIQIGDQWWMAENFKGRHAADGAVLAGVYAYENNEGYVADYGRLYTWQAALNGAPTGWHLPSEAEWDILENYLNPAAATKLKVGGSSGFNVKFGGSRGYEGGYSGLSQWGVFWTSSPSSDDHSFTRLLATDLTIILHNGLGVIAANSVRYLMDD